MVEVFHFMQEQKVTSFKKEKEKQFWTNCCIHSDQIFIFKKSDTAI